MSALVESHFASLIVRVQMMDAAKLVKDYSLADKLTIYFYGHYMLSCALGTSDSELMFSLVCSPSTHIEENALKPCKLNKHFISLHRKNSRPHAIQVLIISSAYFCFA